eukprot:scaffold90492_cov75-Phaeocystis_antarctica.AAC.1
MSCTLRRAPTSLPLPRSSWSRVAALTLKPNRRGVEAARSKLERLVEALDLGGGGRERVVVAPHPQLGRQPVLLPAPECVGVDLGLGVGQLRGQPERVRAAVRGGQGQRLPGGVRLWHTQAVLPTLRAARVQQGRASRAARMSFLASRLSVAVNRSCPCRPTHETRPLPSSRKPHPSLPCSGSLRATARATRDAATWRVLRFLTSETNVLTPAPSKRWRYPRRVSSNLLSSMWRGRSSSAPRHSGVAVRKRSVVGRVAW